MTTIWLAGSGITAALTSFVLACPLVGELFILRLINIFSRYIGLLVGWFLLVSSLVVGVWGDSLPFIWQIIVVSVPSIFAVSSFLVIILLAFKLLLYFSTRFAGNHPIRG
ncbi:hypothetical protein F5141DRAFT_1071558 [Pisolithus sp. B1]|nr:hypothetical protein F5141DRAFT_1071558 [Pisolithus sp. B1]